MSALCSTPPRITYGEKRGATDNESAVTKQGDLSRYRLITVTTANGKSSRLQWYDRETRRFCKNPYASSESGVPPVIEGAPEIAEWSCKIDSTSSLAFRTLRDSGKPASSRRATDTSAPPDAPEQTSTAQSITAQRTPPSPRTVRGTLRHTPTLKDGFDDSGIASSISSTSLQDSSFQHSDFIATTYAAVAHPPYTVESPIEFANLSGPLISRLPSSTNAAISGDGCSDNSVSQRSTPAKAVAVTEAPPPLAVESSSSPTSSISAVFRQRTQRPSGGFTTLLAATLPRGIAHQVNRALYDVTFGLSVLSSRPYGKPLLNGSLSWELPPAAKTTSDDPSRPGIQKTLITLTESASNALRYVIPWLKPEASTHASKSGFLRALGI